MFTYLKRLLSRRSAPLGPTPQGPAVVLGQQMASALESERRHRTQTCAGPSPLGAESRYSANATDFSNLTSFPLDARISEFCERFERADDATRSQHRDSLTIQDFYTLLTFSKRCSLLAKRDKDRVQLTHACAAISAIDVHRLDPRDLLVSLAFLRDAAIALGSSPETYFEPAARLSHPAVAVMLRDFLRRPEATANLRAMGYMSIPTSSGAALMQAGFKPYAPTIALDRLALELSNVLRDDKYEATVTLAEALPAVWLRSIDDAALQRVLATARAGATVHGMLRAEESPDHSLQMLALFLIEVSSDSDADDLLRIARAKILTRPEFTLEPFASGRLFCLLIARCVMQGKPAYETTDSIKRFAPRIHQILSKAFNTAT